MDNYRMFGAPDAKDVEQIIYASQPASAGTYIVYAEKDRTISRTPVVLWGVLDDGTTVPLTLSGVWDGVSNQNNFILFPDGSCGKYQENWESIDEAIDGVKQYAT